MPPKKIEVNLGKKFKKASTFKRENPELKLIDFFNIFPAKIPTYENLTDDQLNQPLSNFQFQPINIENIEYIEFGKNTPNLCDELDHLWLEDQHKQKKPEPQKDSNAHQTQAVDKSYPKKISDTEAVQKAYHYELDTIADFLRNDLSVLVICDKMLTDYIYEFVCSAAGKQIILDNQKPDNNKTGLGTQMDQALQGGNAAPLEHLPVLINQMNTDDILVIRSLDMIDSPQMIELLYQTTTKGLKPQILAFLDSSLEVKKVLSDRFAIHVSIIGLSRYISLDGKQQSYTVDHLLTQKERSCFADYEPESLYKNVAGLNALQFRNAMKYVGAMSEPGKDSNDIYQLIRQFKKSSSDEIEIPDIKFEEIGGYDHVKQLLKRIIALIAGPISGIDEKHRNQLIPRGFIFHGPPGTGKTLFAKAIANEMNATIQMVSGPEIMDKYVGQSENNLRKIFATARRNAPAVVFFDEFDSIAGQRSNYADGGARSNNAVVAQLLTELDGFRQDQSVLIIGTTNRIDIIDEALIRPSRLQPVEINLPDYSARKSVANIHATNFGVCILLKDLYNLASKHLDSISHGKKINTEQDIPDLFLEELFDMHHAYEKRFQQEGKRAGFLRELQSFLEFIDDSRKGTKEQAQTKLLDHMNQKIMEIGKHYQFDFSQENIPKLDSPEAEPIMFTMQSDIKTLFSMIQQERQKMGGIDDESFINALMDLIAEYTVGFNNDEIRAIFQEASLEHHMEGQLITPRYLGLKIGLIRKRSEERLAVHIGRRREV